MTDITELAREMREGLDGPVPLERLQQLMAYDPETGDLRWKVDRLSGRNHNRVNARAGDMLSFVDKMGYILVSVDKSRFRGHQAAFALYHGRWAKGQIDHINGDRSDNRIVNLREATNAQNGWNRGKQKNNTSGFKGVTMGTHGRWTSGIWVNGKRRHLGYFDTAKAASIAYEAAALELHGEFGRPA